MILKFFCKSVMLSGTEIRELLPFCLSYQQLLPLEILFQTSVMTWKLHLTR